MSETLLPPEQLTNPLETVQRYLEIMRGTEIEEYREARGMIDDVMFNNTPALSSRDGLTHYAIESLIDYNHRPYLADRSNDLNMWRKTCTVHVVRQMMQGKKFPLQDFDVVVDDVLGTLAHIDGKWAPTKRHKELVKDEVIDVLGCERGRSGDAEVVRRAGEIYKHVGRPRKYGRIMVRAARLERRQQSKRR